MRSRCPPKPSASGENRLRFVFASTASPSEQPGNADRRQLAAAFHSLVVGAAGDTGLDDLLRRDAPPAFGAIAKDGIPALVQVGPSVVRYAIRLPPRAELRFTPELHPAATASAAAALFKVTLEKTPGREEELWSARIGPGSSAPARGRGPAARAARET